MPRLPALDLTLQVNESPHVVILGAGASYAAAPQGDAQGRRLPLMNNFVETLDLGPSLDALGVTWRGRNFEEVYSELHARGPENPDLQKLEKRVRDYFADLVLPDQLSAYDYLLLTLREKDVIATFNWDPFLVQAARRHRAVRRLPQLLFLHGCAVLAVCAACKTVDLVGRTCLRCKGPLTPSRLLYPVAEKNYTSDPFISSNWEALRTTLNYTYFITIFGYGAPTSDAAAVELLKDAWAMNETRILAQVEIIDVKPEEELHRTWAPFITRQHYACYTAISDTYLAWHPRRSCEALAFATLQNDPWPDNWIPELASPEDLQLWIQPLVAQEIALQTARTPLPRDPCPPLTSTGRAT